MSYLAYIDTKTSAEKETEKAMIIFASISQDIELIEMIAYKYHNHHSLRDSAIMCLFHAARRFKHLSSESINFLKNTIDNDPYEWARCVAKDALNYL